MRLLECVSGIWRGEEILLGPSLQLHQLGRLDPTKQSHQMLYMGVRGVTDLMGDNFLTILSLSKLFASNSMTVREQRVSKVNEHEFETSEGCFTLGNVAYLMSCVWAVRLNVQPPPIEQRQRNILINHEKYSMNDSPHRVIEFFCGIGGLHYSFAYSMQKGLVVQAYDISEVTNQTYQHNFGFCPSTSGIDCLTPEMIEPFRANVWLMSPPCQPFVRGGKHLDTDDGRSKGLLNLIAILPKLQLPPQYVFVENVVLFEQSKSRELLINTLDGLGYDLMEFLISSSQFGVPNDRQRYYLCARNPGLGKVRRRYLDGPVTFHSTWPLFSEHIQSNITLEKYLEDLSPQEEEIYLVPSNWLTTRHGFRFEIAYPTSTKTGAFTKSYATRYVIGTGAYLATRECSDWKFEDPESLEGLRLRLFTPKEIARLHSFPVDETVNAFPGHTEKYPVASLVKFDRKNATKEQHEAYKREKLAMQSQEKKIKKERLALGHDVPHSFSFPPEIQLKHQYRALGNSLSVKVVGELLKNVLFNDTDSRLFQREL
jgi:tRNA (cytosine38-C5)-methyltransferase